MQLFSRCACDLLVQAQYTSSVDIRPEWHVIGDQINFSALQKLATQAGQPEVGARRQAGGRPASGGRRPLLQLANVGGALGLGAYEGGAQPLFPEERSVAHVV